MNPRVILFFLLFSSLGMGCSSSLYGQFSLFLPSQKQEPPQASSKASPAPPHLYAIIYMDDSHWSLWINDQVITAENQYIIKDLVIKKVTPERVTLSITYPGNREKSLTLSPTSP